MNPRVPRPAGQKNGPEYYWAQAKKFGDAGFTAYQLHAKTKDVGFVTVRGYLDTLRGLGLIETIGKIPQQGRRARFLYRVTRDAARAPSSSAHRFETTKRGAAQQNLWTAMRTLPAFVLNELAVVASTEEVPVTAGTSQVYVSRLVRAGLVTVVQKQKRRKGHGTGTAPAVFRLLPSASTGPAALCIVGDRVFDPNVGEFVGCSLNRAEVSA